MNIDTEEIWKPTAASDWHEVSSLGRVRTMDRVYLRCDGALVQYSGIIKRLCKGNNGYLFFSIPDKNKKSGKHNMNVHVAVARAFHPNPDNKPVVNHKNGIKTDNRSENLEWVTHKENSHHAIHVLGIRTSHRGENVRIRKLNNSDIIEILGLVKNTGYIEIAKKFGVSRWTINTIALRRKWAHVLPDLPPLKKRKERKKTIRNASVPIYPPPEVVV